MEREEIEAVWERIKALEENSLKISKTLGEQNIWSIVGILRSRVPVRRFEVFKDYLQPKSEKALEDIGNAQNVEEVIKVIRQFNDNCLKFVKALHK